MTIHSSNESSAKPVAVELQSHLPPGLILLPLRLIVGWTYFSAFWRRMVLENKLDPDAAGYIGEKFNHFLPNALLIKPAIEFFVSNPDLLWWKLLVFTIVEAIVGGFLMVGLFTRLMGVLTSLLALGILLGAGWLGTTCLDEWQIGILGIGSGLAFAWAGGGSYSLDALFRTKLVAIPNRIAQWSTEVTPRMSRILGPSVIAMTVLTFGLTLLTNQIFHGGVYGKLHNKSVTPKIEISDAMIEHDRLSVDLYRVEGADVYGSFAIELRVSDLNGNVLVSWDGKALSQLPTTSISNRYVAQIKPGKHSLIIPLGAKGTITVEDARLASVPDGDYNVELVDVSGLSWVSPLKIVRPKDMEN